MAGHRRILFSALLLWSVHVGADAIQLPGIIGAWQCQIGYQGAVVGTAQLSFLAGEQVRLNQEMMSYQVISGNQLQLRDATGQYDYRYLLQGDTLQMQYVDGSAFLCRRSSNAPQSDAEAAAPGIQQNPQDANAWQLQGPFCHYSGSSSAYGDSSYSRTQRITFDGRGRWSFGSESSFSGDAGLAYGQGGGDSGSYRIQGRQILYRTGAGEEGVARVNMQQSNGMITEIFLDGELYAPSLCE